ncbi:hypothetical protein E5259_19090 [Blautia producta]|uniref:Uncharacterized protein n=1 Tax=Blautia producta TaxID=33035 RepID=A0A7G5MY50_9FIRM|nr:hypothetical protein [Blautia producta]QMW79543.1 hypothetical protein E5259_19090 [Blautia producta]
MPYSSKDWLQLMDARPHRRKNPISYTGMIAYMHKLGGHYCGTTSWDLFYRQLMMIIKYATTHSQSIMAGCTSYSAQHMNLVAETGVTRVTSQSHRRHPMWSDHMFPLEKWAKPQTMIDIMHICITWHTA